MNLPSRRRLDFATAAMLLDQRRALSARYRREPAAVLPEWHRLRPHVEAVRERLSKRFVAEPEADWDAARAYLAFETDAEALFALYVPSAERERHLETASAAARDLQNDNALIDLLEKRITVCAVLNQGVKIPHLQQQQKDLNAKLIRSWRGRQLLHLQIMAEPWAKNESADLLPGVWRTAAMWLGVPRAHRAPEQQRFLRAARRRAGWTAAVYAALGAAVLAVAIVGAVPVQHMFHAGWISNEIDATLAGGGWANSDDLFQSLLGRLDALDRLSAADGRQKRELVRGRFVQRLQGYLDTSLSEEDWNEFLKVASRLEALDPNDAATFRLRLGRKAAKDLSERIEKWNGDAATAAALDSEISRIAQLAPAEVEPLRKQLDARQRLPESFVIDAAKGREQFQPPVPSDAAAGGLQLAEAESPMVKATRIESGLTIDARARFQLSKVSANQPLGIVFGHVPQPVPSGRLFFAGIYPVSGYAFLFQPEQLEDDVWRGVMSLTRDGVSLRRRWVRVRGPDLEFHARRDGNRLAFSLNGDDFAALAWEDEFMPGPMPAGVVGLLWPREAALTSLKVERRQAPAAPRPREAADEQYFRGRYADAAAAYARELAADRSAPPANSAHELLARWMSRRTDAVEKDMWAFAEEADDEWSVTALCHLGLGALQKANSESARKAWKHLAVSQLSPAAMDERVPDSVRRALVDTFRPLGQVITFAKWDRNWDHDVGMAVALAKKIGGLPPEDLLRLQTWQIDAMHGNGRLQEAANLTRELLDAPWWPDAQRQDPYRLLSLYEKRTWLLIGLRQGEKARAELVRAQTLPEFRSNPSAVRRLRVEAARASAAARDWDTAIKELRALLPELAEGGFPDTAYPGAVLLLGTALQEGDADAALAAWRDGFERVRKQQWWNDVEVSVLASVCGRMSEDEAVKTVNAVLPGIPDDRAIIGILRVGGLGPRDVHAILQGLYRNSPTGRDAARRIALRDISLVDYFTIQMKLTLIETCRALAPMAAPAAEDFWRDTATAMFLQYQLGALTNLHLRDLGMFMLPPVYSLTVNREKTLGSLEPPLQAPVALILGFRYRAKSLDADAKWYFRFALENAPDGSAVRRMANDALALPPKPK